MKHIIPQAVEQGDSLVQRSLAALILYEVSGGYFGIDLFELVEWIEDGAIQVFWHAMIYKPFLGIKVG